MKPETAELKKKIKNVLDRERYQHTLGVAYTASCLAMRYSEDPERLFTAGLLHDCAKNIPTEQKFSMCRKYGIELSEVESKNPSLIHAKLGAYLAEHTYGIKDQDILNAVKNHTTGRPGMTMCEKIIFTADYIEPHRDQAPDLPVVRELAFSNLEEAILKILHDTLFYLKKGGKETDPMTRLTYEFYSAKLKGFEKGGV